MILTTIPNMGGRDYQVLGMVTGSMVQSKNAFKDIGGELHSYTEMMQEARHAATMRMIDQAEQMGADAIIGVSYATSSIVQGAAEVLATGTAVKLL